ncbi:copper chaperone PCu(A)C [Cohaesibacter celericrescens]|uniref:copper chaperone PCu(A)C n=1 Tax=Cohaesibacter celericrescens TaxID=2067669 RepID=UPI0035641F1D
MRLLAFLILLLVPFAAGAADHGDHSEHVSDLDGFRAVHAWTRATSDDTTLVFMELENGNSATIVVNGGQSEIASSGQLVGFVLKDGAETWQDIPSMPVQPNHDLHLEPHGLALLLSGLSTPLVEGDMFVVQLNTSIGDLMLHVEVEDVRAGHHSHAGHSH